jgi:hypothetical protein
MLAERSAAYRTRLVTGPNSPPVRYSGFRHTVPLGLGSQSMPAVSITTRCVRSAWTSGRSFGGLVVAEVGVFSSIGDV